MNKHKLASIKVGPGSFLEGKILGNDEKGILTIEMGQVGHKNQANKAWFYPSKFLRLRCAVDLLKIYNRASDPIKEMSEVWGIWEALSKRGLNLDSKGKIRAVVVGDGNTPRTGALLACMTTWDVLSFDPAFAQGIEHVNWDWVERMTAMASTLEEVEESHRDMETVIVFPHAHANAELALAKFRAAEGHKTHMVSMPCCLFEKQTLRAKPTLHYFDSHVLSDKNEILIWENI